MKYTLLLAIGLVTQLALGAYEPSPDGKFFYTELYYEDAITYMKLKIGSEQQEIKMMFNSEEYTLAVFTTWCVNPISGYGKC